MDELKSIILLRSHHILKILLSFNFKKHFVFLLFVICCFFPLDVAYQNIKTMKSGLKISAKRNKPPLIALTDENISPSFEIIELQQNKLKPFILAKTSSIASVERVIHIKKPLAISPRVLELKPIRIELIKEEPLKTLNLKGVKFSSAETIQLLNTQKEKDYAIASQHYENNTLSNVMDRAEKQVELARTNEVSDFERRWFAYMKERERTTVSAGPSLQANSIITPSHGYNNATDEISFAREARFEPTNMVANSSLISSENVENFVPPQKWVGDIWVGLPDQKPSPKPNPVIISPYTHNNAIDKPDFSRETLIPREARFQPVNMIASSGMTTSVVDIANKNLQEKLITLPPIKAIGNITLLNGLGLGEGDQLDITYVNSCSVEYDAEVDLKNGRFNIDIGNPSFGFLRAQLRDQNGLLRGSGEISLRDFFQVKLLEDPHFSSDSIEMDLQVVPSEHSSTVQVLNMANKEPLRDFLIEIGNMGRFTSSHQNGLFSIPEMLAGSSFIARVHTESLWKTLFLSTNDISYDREIPTETFLTSLQGHLSHLNLDLSVILGRVLRNGRPLERASVELAESYNNPYYLTTDNQFIEGGQTTSTGYFAYVNVPPGLQILKVKDHNERTIIPSRILWADRGYISSVQLEETSKREAQGCIFDSQTGSLLSARVNYLGSDIEEEVDSQSGFLSVNFFNGVDPLYFELLPNERGYYPMILMSHRNRSSISFPMSSRAWINEITARYKINQHPDLAMIIGHVSHSSFETSVEDVNDYAENCIF